MSIYINSLAKLFFKLFVPLTICRLLFDIFAFDA